MTHGPARGRPTRSLSSRCTAAAALVTVTLALVGCSDDTDPDEPTSDPTLAIEDTPSTWAPVVAEVADAVAEAGAGTARTDSNPEVFFYDSSIDHCVYSSLRYEFDTVFGDQTSWDDVRRAVEDVVAPRGLEITEQLDIPGGHNGFDAVGEDGTRLQVRSKTATPSTISLSAPGSGSCDRERNEVLDPLPASGS